MTNASEKCIYLDYNATTPYAPSVKEIMIEVINEYWGNPSSRYSKGKQAKSIIDKSRDQVANMIEAKESEIVFLSGGTEANNTAIRSVIDTFHKLRKKPHVITTKIEHDATLKLILHLLKHEEIRATFLSTNSDGSIDPNVLRNSIEEDTVLVTLMLANNETGGLLDLKKCCDLLKETNKQRSSAGLGKIYFHVDAAQALGKIPVSVIKTPVDYLTIVGHKFYGPRIGALYVKEGAPLSSIVKGGSQENGRRPGTENTACIAGLGEASRLVAENVIQYQERFKKLKRYLKAALLKEFPNGFCVINFPEVPELPQLPNTLSVSFPRISGSRLLENCPLVEASTGAACHSSENANTGSAVLTYLLPEQQAIGSVRLSLGRETTEEDVDRAVQYLRVAYDKL